MDAVLLARIQFAFTVGFHYIFPPITIGLAWILFSMQALYLKTGEEIYEQMADFWTKIFTITFAIGVATGITMEFQFGTNWANYSRFVGDIFGAPLAAEGIFSFFLESTFLGIILYGKNRVSKKVYCFSTLMVAVGATLSAFWIIAANSWQQTPAGFHIINGRAELTDFWAALFNPSTVPRYLHAVCGGLITGSFLMMGLSSYYVLKGKFSAFAQKSLKISLIFAFVFSSLQFIVGHGHAVQVAKNQPAKLAAYEGVWDTTSNASLLIFGVHNAELEKMDYELAVPGFLSFLIDGGNGFVVRGLKEFPKEDRPPLHLTFFSFHAMAYLGGAFFMLSLLGLFLLYRGQLFENKCFLKTAILFIPLPTITNELGWMAAEVGRQPWAVYNILRTKDSVSPLLNSETILFSIIMFSAIYALLFFVWIFLLRHQMATGPKMIGGK